MTIGNDSSFSEFLPFLDDEHENLILKSSSEVQEDVHFVLFPDSVFKYLFDIYGGRDIRRFSIELNDETLIHSKTESNISSSAS